MFLASTKVANARELMKILNERSSSLVTLLSSSVSPIQLSMPTDGKGARIRVSVHPQDVAKVPKSAELTIEGENIEVPLEASGDYQDYEPY